MAAAYAYADRGRPFPEWEILGAVKRWGGAAVLGRAVLSAREIRMFNAIEYVVALFQASRKAQNWATWANEHLHEANFLNRLDVLAGQLFPEEEEEA